MLTVAGLADRSSLNMTQQNAEMLTVLGILCQGTQYSVKFCARKIRFMHIYISLFMYLFLRIDRL